MKGTRPELTWGGKKRRTRTEPRVLVEDEALSYRAARRAACGDQFDNRLIHGDNLQALRALEPEFAGRVKCVYIDPPFNVGEATEYYDDGLEHSLWLGLMRDRVEVLHRLLAADGSLFVHIDDNELAYLILLLDEKFGRHNRVAVVTFKQGSATGHKSINPCVVSTSNFVVVYAKDKARCKFNRVYTGRERDKRYGQFVVNREDDYRRWRFTTLARAFAESLGLPEKQARKIDDYEERLGEFVLRRAESVTRLARPAYEDVSAAARALIDESKSRPGDIFRLERDGYADMYLVNGQRILFYADKLKLIDGRRVAGEPLTSIWDDLLSNNLHQEGGVHFPKGKKPEALLKRVIELATRPGDLVLDAFAGSGTTGAVAHKMGRRWIMVERGDHIQTHILPRLRGVVDGTDQGGVTRAVGWAGGGGFRYLRLAPPPAEHNLSTAFAEGMKC